MKRFSSKGFLFHICHWKHTPWILYTCTAIHLCWRKNIGENLLNNAETLYHLIYNCYFEMFLINALFHTLENCQWLIRHTEETPKHISNNINNDEIGYNLKKIWGGAVLSSRGFSTSSFYVFQCQSSQNSCTPYATQEVSITLNWHQRRHLQLPTIRPLSLKQHLMRTYLVRHNGNCRFYY